eukprot:3823427-Karenia_brevis.AAC.1
MSAFTAASHASAVLFDALAKEAKALLKDFNSQKLANAVSAFAAAGHASLVLFDALAVKARRA